MYKAKVKTPVCPVRRGFQDSSEMITQFVYGEIVTVIEEKDQWRKCISDFDKYEGWADEKLIVKVENEVETEGVLTQNALQHVDLPEGKRWLPAGSFANVPQTRMYREPFQNAELFIGAPYLWGGKTVFGIDCSGLVQIAFLMSGKRLKRDAYQQAELGHTVAFVEEAQNNDLAFFDNDEGRINHVGIVRKDDDGLRIIHASGEVRIDKFDHQGIFKESTGKYTHKLRILKRID
ncbi:MAG: C40 family peptidase [Flavobacteriales bacterium]|nr:C40 family peptidase [Flavobacteriales bacterium]MDG1780545.1 C40 family peptidase [Flavobacteriales bacterium]MDG2245762.1 C40 family peptidase [Flavobacteriales bacterium]